MNITVICDGVEYQAVNRKADVGEKVIDTEGEMQILTIIESPYPSDCEWYEFKTEHGVDIAPIRQREYLVLEPLKTKEPTAEVTAKDCSPAVLGMLANLSRRIVELEAEIKNKATHYAVNKSLEETAELEERVQRNFNAVNDQLDTLFRNQVKQAEDLENSHYTGLTAQELADNIAEVMRNAGFKING
jgi:hypothetical protein